MFLNLRTPPSSRFDDHSFGITLALYKACDSHWRASNREDNMKKIALVLGLLFSASTLASIDCHTPRMNKAFKIEDSRVTFFNDQSLESGREVASVGARTRKTAKGFTKILKFEGRKHTIHISDKNSFSNVDDYMIVKNNKGHEMTYPLSCK
jgi:hypothetical protein